MYQEKVEFLTKNLEQLQETVLRQQENLQTTVEMIRIVGFRSTRLTIQLCQDERLTSSHLDPFRKRERSNKAVHPPKAVAHGKHQQRHDTIRDPPVTHNCTYVLLVTPTQRGSFTHHTSKSTGCHTSALC